MVLKENIAAFKRMDRFSKQISQNKKHENTEILTYFAGMTKKFNIIFFALQKNQFTVTLSVLVVFKKTSQLLNG